MTHETKSGSVIDGGRPLLEGTRLALNPDAAVTELFREFNERFFWDKLKYVEVRWSPRMTLCAGVCVYNRRPGYCSIRLSRPLLSLRGKIDLVETLLHEMIHAYLFVTENNRDRDGHGPEFLKHMNRINQDVGLNISVFHTFKDEVRHYQQHVWQCNGPCQLRPPYYGKVYRAMNRAPGPTDLWWFEHTANCSGSFTKVAEPEGYKPQRKKAVTCSKESVKKKNKDIRSFFKPVDGTTAELKQPGHSSNSKEDIGSVQKLNDESEISFSETDKNSQTGDPKDEKNINGTETSSEDNISEDEDASEDDSDSSGSEDTFIGIIGSIFGSPFQILKRPAQDPDPSTIKVRKPNFSAVPKSKRGTLRNLIQVPDQPTLDAFYKKKRLSARKEPQGATSSSKKRENLRQTSVQSFFSIPK